MIVCSSATARWGRCCTRKGVFINRCFESLNLTQPELRRRRAPRVPDAPAPTSSRPTRSAPTASSCAASAWATRCARSISPARGWRARRPRRGEAYVAGAIGPLGVRIEPWGKTGVDEAEAIFREQAQALLDGGVDLFILETFRDLNEIGAAIAAVRSVCDLPIVAQMTTEEDGNSLDGTPPEQFAPELEQARRRRGRRQLQRRARRRCSKRSSASPTIVPMCGSRRSPTPASRATSRAATSICVRPEYMASYARRFIAAGVRLVGGCCGTTPEHIRQIKRWRSRRWRRGRASQRRRGRGDRPPCDASRMRSRRSRASEKSRLARRAGATARFVTASSWCRRAATRPIDASTRRARLQATASTSVHDPRRPALRRADERAVAGGAGAAAGRHRSAAAVFLPRPQSARHPVGSARRARDGRAQRARHHRRRARGRRLSRRDGGRSTSIRSG